MASHIYRLKRFRFTTLLMLYAIPGFAAETMPDPGELLAGLQRERLAITSGVMEWDVTFNSGVGVIEPRRVRLAVAFEGQKFRFAEDRPGLRVDWIRGHDSSFLDKQIRLRSVWGGPDAIVRDGLGHWEVQHVRTIYDGTHQMRYSKNQQTRVSDAKNGSGGLAFDPRSLGLTSSFQSPYTSLDRYLAPRVDEAVRLMGRESVGVVSSWHVAIDGGAMKVERHFWIGDPPGFRLHKAEYRGRGGRSVIDSEYDPLGKGDAGRIPARVKILQTDGSGKVIQDLILERSPEPKGDKVGKPIDPESWTFAGLGMPIGEPVYDTRLKRVVGYWDGKALSETQLPRPIEVDSEPPKPSPVKLLEVARRDPGGQLALDALREIALRSPSSNEAADALQLLMEQHISSAGVGEVGSLLSEKRPEATEQLLRAVHSNNPIADDRARAGFGLARVLVGKSERIGSGAPGDAAVAEAKLLFERIISTDPNIEGFPYGRLAVAAKRLLGDLEDTGVGRPAPALSGIDLEGKPLSLDSYLGKVVVVSFWFTGCRPCMEMIPQERELVTRMSGRPFALLGVNTDHDRLLGKSTSLDRAMTWPSLWAGAKSDPIPSRWCISSFPATFVLDARGVIRFKNLRGKDLETAVIGLVDAVERKK